MVLVLRKCSEDGGSYYDPNFKYGQVGERVTAPNWNPEPKCGNGLHGLKEGNGEWGLLNGSQWLVIDADDQVVDIDDEKCKFNTGIILFRGTAEELSKTDYSKTMALDSKSAYWWARFIGNTDVMINRINDETHAYLWAYHIGNRDIMISKIENSCWAYHWAVFIGNEDMMKSKIVEDSWIFQWNLQFPNDKI